MMPALARRILRWIEQEIRFRSQSKQRRAAEFFFLAVAVG